MVPGLRALVVALATVLAVGTALLLRADSAGPDVGAAELGMVAVAVAAVQWRLLAPGRTAAAVVSGLLLAQLACQLAVQALGLQADLTAAVCCPAVPADPGAGALAALTAQAGAALLVAQLVAASLTAVSVRSAHLAVLDAVRRAAASLLDALPDLAALVALLRAEVPPVPAAPVRPRPDEALLPRTALTLTCSATRRGPPRRSVRPPSCPSVHTAAGAAVS